MFMLLGDMTMSKYIKVILPLFVLSLLILTASTIPGALAFGSGHPDTCQPCHGTTATTTDNINGTNYNFWDHSITNNATQIWGNCLQCHSNYVSGTVHQSLGCKGCHSVVHIGYNNSGTWAAWVFAYEPNITSLPALKPTINDFVAKTTVLTNTNYTSVSWGTTIKNLAGANGMEIEVGVWDGFNNEYLSTLPAGSIKTSSWKLCFSCHFLASNPAQVGAYKLENGVWKIGIPEYALKLPPHEITSSQLTETVGSETSTPLSTIIIAAMTGVAGIGVLFVRKRETAL